MKRYLFNVLVTFDCFMSAITGGLPGETLSGRAGSAFLQGSMHGYFWARVINFIMRNPDHCVNAIRNDELRARAVLKDDSK